MPPLTCSAAFTQFVFFLIPSRIMSEIDWSRSRKFFPSAVMQSPAPLTAADLRLFRGYKNDDEHETVDMSAREVGPSHVRTTCTPRDCPS